MCAQLGNLNTIVRLLLEYVYWLAISPIDGVITDSLVLFSKLGSFLCWAPLLITSQHFYTKTTTMMIMKETSRFVDQLVTTSFNHSTAILLTYTTFLLLPPSSSIFLLLPLQICTSWQRMATSTWLF